MEIKGTIIFSSGFRVPGQRIAGTGKHRMTILGGWGVAEFAPDGFLDPVQIRVARLVGA